MTTGNPLFGMTPQACTSAHRGNLPVAPGTGVSLVTPETAPRFAPLQPPPAAVGGAEELLFNALVAAAELRGNGLWVIGFAHKRQAGVDHVVINVAPSPRLHLIYPDCIWTQRRQDGALTVFTWFAIREGGVRIEWEESWA